MVGFKTTHSNVKAQVSINQPPQPPPPHKNVMNSEAEVSLHPDLYQTPRVAGPVKLLLIEPQVLH